MVSVPVSAVKTASELLPGSRTQRTPETKLPSRLVTCKTQRPLLRVKSLPVWIKSFCDAVCFCEQPQKSRLANIIVLMVFIKSRLTRIRRRVLQPNLVSFHNGILDLNGCQTLSIHFASFVAAFRQKAANHFNAAVFRLRLLRRDEADAPPLLFHRLRRFLNHFFLLQFFQLLRDGVTCLHKIGIVSLTQLTQI